MNKTKWFEEARFGMFIHFGLYSIPARGEWVRSAEKMSTEEYQPFFEEFNPEVSPVEWAKAAKAAGMKYVVMTAKHHDGFCLFDSEYTDYKITNTPYGRDFVREYVEAVRAEGLGVGLYFSLLDWHHPHYPKYNDLFHPMRGNEAYKDEVIDFDVYLDYMHKQVEEICKNYGKIDILWFDFSYGEMAGEKWRATELMSMVREYQPDVLVDNRLEGSGHTMGSIFTDAPKPYSGDFYSPEQYIPVDGIKKADGSPIPWELCTTMNNQWSYVPTDTLYKTPQTIIRKLTECVSKGGNMLLNVGPDAKGRFSKESMDILNAIGKWMSENGDSIHGCAEADIPKPEWGRYTRRDNIIYAHIHDTTIGPVPLTGIPRGSIQKIRFLTDNSEVPLASWAFAVRKNPDMAFVSLGSNQNHSYPLPDEMGTVLAVYLKS